MISNKNMQRNLVSVTSGELIDLNELNVNNDKAGFAVSSDSNIIHAPCRGTIMEISQKADTFTLLSDDGLIVKILIGIEMHFKPMRIISYITKNERVERGQILAIIEKEYILPSNKKFITPVYVINTEKLKNYNIIENGRKIGGKSISLTYKI